MKGPAKCDIVKKVRWPRAVEWCRLMLDKNPIGTKDHLTVSLMGQFEVNSAYR
jgi:hypothetical protein